MRLNRPIGILLLLWPTLWGLWLAGQGSPDPNIVFIFVLGVIFMRSAGCVINDYADRKIDRHVKRTENRPITNKQISPHLALVLFLILISFSFLLVLFLNKLSIILSVFALFFAATYPFIKRYTNLPQAYLGVTFSFSIPMAFAAQVNSLPLNLLWIVLPTIIWVVIYDTIYAMVDRDDDLKIGVKSTAILFGKLDIFIIGILQILLVISLYFCGLIFKLGIFYNLSILFVVLLAIYHQWLIKDRDRNRCLKAFLNNHWIGAMIFFGIVGNYLY